jgi:hypothetical protein
MLKIKLLKYAMPGNHLGLSGIEAPSFNYEKISNANIINIYYYENITTN